MSKSNFDRIGPAGGGYMPRSAQAQAPARDARAPARASTREAAAHGPPLTPDRSVPRGHPNSLPPRSDRLPGAAHPAYLPAPPRAVVAAAHHLLGVPEGATWAQVMLGPGAHLLDVAGLQRRAQEAARSGDPHALRAVAEDHADTIDRMVGQMDERVLQVMHRAQAAGAPQAGLVQAMFRQAYGEFCTEMAKTDALLAHIRPALPARPFTGARADQRPRTDRPRPPANGSPPRSIPQGGRGSGPAAGRPDGARPSWRHLDGMAGIAADLARARGEIDAAQTKSDLKPLRLRLQGLGGAFQQALGAAAMSRPPGLVQSALDGFLRDYEAAQLQLNQRESGPMGAGAKPGEGQ